MFDLCPRRVPGFSTGSLLAPRGWTADVAAHYVVHSSTAAAVADLQSRDALKGGTAADAGSERLPLGSSSNTARFECLTGDQEGSTLYVTELFVQHGPTQATSSSEKAPAVWDAERLRSLLVLQCSSGGGDKGSEVRDGADTARVWVMEIQDERADDRPVRGESTPSTSLYAALHPFYRVFVEVVWLLSPSHATKALDEATKHIVADLQRRYCSPALELDTFRCFSLRTSATDAESAQHDVLTDAAAITAAVSSVQQPLKEPCAPVVLADTHSFHISPLFSTCLYSGAGSAFIQLLLTPRSQSQGGSPPQLVTTEARWNVNCGVHREAKGREGGSVEPSNPRNTSLRPTSASAASVVRLMRDRLCLHWEGLSVALRPSFSAANTTEREGTCADEVVVAAASLELSALSTPTSLYSFRSVEEAWEAHVTFSLQRETTSPSESQDETMGSCGVLQRWAMRKLLTTPAPRLEEMSAAMEEAELSQLRMEDPCITPAERAMRCIEACSAPSPLPPRCSTYLLQLVVENVDSATHTSEGVRTGETKEAYLLRLHAPRVQSGHAIVVGMAVPAAAVDDVCDASAMKDEEITLNSNTNASDMPCGKSVALWAATLSSSYRLAPHTPSLWLPREVGRAGTSGVSCRSGRLVLHIPAGVPAYEGVRLAPVASRSFVSLGSVAAWVQRGMPDAGDSFLPLPAGAAFTQVGAVWTLVGDGRSAATYLEDALMEHMYDTGSKNLNNIHQPSQHALQPGVLVVRKRRRQKVRAASASGHGAAAALMGSYEICSAWLDIGTAHRLLLRVQDVGVGEVLVTEASLVGTHVEEKEASHAGHGAAVKAASQVSRAEEEALEQWLEGITASAVQKNFR